jgi:sialic acid synthase SpsE
VIDLPTPDRPGVLAELGQTCGADVSGYVLSVEELAETGVWGVKVQMIDPGRLAAADAAPYWHTPRYADGQAESFALAGCVPHDAWGPVRDRCDELGLAFVATPFDLDAVDALVDLRPDAVKIASGDITYLRLVDACATRFTQLIISTGASDVADVAQVGRWVRKARGFDRADDRALVYLACSLEYPTPTESAALGRIATLADFTRHPAGYSDHTVQVSSAEAAAMGAALGASGCVLAEKHVVTSWAAAEHGQVPDLDMAMPTELLRSYQYGLQLGANLRGSAVLAELGAHRGEEAARVGARRSLIVHEALPAGHVIVDDDLMALRPCPAGSIPPDHAALLVGRTVAVDVKPGRVVRWTQAEGAIEVDTVPV